ncbi:MAG: arginase family protein [Gammaproteobacteria bacterium]|nr:arginase family protein [Gammaproteobacteria bacterium]
MNTPKHGKSSNKLRLTLANGILLLLAFASTANAQRSEEWQLPEELSAKVEMLDLEQQLFIVSGDYQDFIPPRQLEHALTTRDVDELSVMFADLMAVAEEMGYEPERDMGAMPLNLSTDEFHNGVIRPPILREEEREPGPFSVHRYLFPESGIPTFAGAKVAIWPEDLIAGDVDVAIVGVPNDMGSGRRNAEYGPRVMRALDTLALPDVDSLLNPREVLSIADYGDFAIDNMSTELTVDHVTSMVTETAGTGAVPMMVGGDTSMLYPGVKGVATTHGYGEIGLVHFSAHPDSDTNAVHTVSDEQALFLLLDEGILSGEDVVTVGLRGPAVDVDTLQWLRDQEVRYHTMAEITRYGYDSVLERVLEEVEEGPEKFFVSIDVSVIEPSQMVAAGRIVSNGLSVQQVASSIRQLCAEKEIVGFEITDMAPMLDFSRLSAVNANTVLNACLVGLAVRKSGLSADYVHPLAIDHGQD